MLLEGLLIAAGGALVQFIQQNSGQIAVHASRIAREELQKRQLHKWLEDRDACAARICSSKICGYKECPFSRGEFNLDRERYEQCHYVQEAFEASGLDKEP